MYGTVELSRRLLYCPILHNIGFDILINILFDLWSGRFQRLVLYSPYLYIIGMLQNPTIRNPTGPLSTLQSIALQSGKKTTAWQMCLGTICLGELCLGANIFGRCQALRWIFEHHTTRFLIILFPTDDGDQIPFLLYAWRMYSVFCVNEVFNKLLMYRTVELSCLRQLACLFAKRYLFTTQKSICLQKALQPAGLLQRLVLFDFFLNYSAYFCILPNSILHDQ